MNPEPEFNIQHTAPFSEKGEDITVPHSMLMAHVKRIAHVRMKSMPLANHRFKLDFRNLQRHRGELWDLMEPIKRCPTIVIERLQRFYNTPEMRVDSNLVNREIRCTILHPEIEEENWKYSKLTGKTTKRENVIRQFQEDPDNRIFLISLKAGGVGLNLTEADYVFIIDPWWNPAAENQAINRAHRIGQNKHVFVYRFISENSIEEKIQKLKERKSSLADKFINSNNPFQKITQEDIVDLFK